MPKLQRPSHASSLWAGGLAIFLLLLIVAIRVQGDQLYQYPANPDPKTLPADALIICLAGGKFRISAAYDLYAQGVGSRLLEALVEDARALGLRRLFCLTFEVDFFARHGFEPIEGQAVEPEVYAELVRSYDEGVAEFLDLERVKPNTLGNTRMLRTL